jgi:hypothetical protein
MRWYTVKPENGVYQVHSAVFYNHRYACYALH